MQDRNQWMDLCAQAALEQDPDSFFYLKERIIALVIEKEAHLKTMYPRPPLARLENS
jgi:hypothetical protein